jgi:hypothetical protein
MSAHVAGFNVGHAVQTLKDSLNAPKTPAAKDRCLLVCHGHWMPIQQGSSMR